MISRGNALFISPGVCIKGECHDNTDNATYYGQRHVENVRDFYPLTYFLIASGYGCLFPAQIKEQIRKQRNQVLYFGAPRYTSHAPADGVVFRPVLSFSMEYPNMAFSCSDRRFFH